MVSPDCEIETTRVLGPNDRVAVAELVAQLDLDRDPAPVLNGVLGNRSGIGGGSAGQHDDLGDRGQLLGGDAQLVKGQAAKGIRTTQQGVCHRCGLVKDFLFHEGIEAALFGAGRVPVDVEFLALGGIARKVGDAVGIGGDRDDLVLAEFHRAAGEVNEAGDIRAQEVLAFAQAQDQRGVAAGSDDNAGVIGVHCKQGERTLELAGGEFHRAGEVAFAGTAVDRAEQCCSHLGVRLRDKFDALGEQLALEFCEVLDDAVVDHGEVAAIGKVGVGIRVGGSAVGRPAGVADAGQRGRQRVCFKGSDEVGELARLLARVDARVRDNGQPGRVVAAILEASKPLKNHIERAMIGFASSITYVSNDSTHEKKITVLHGSPCSFALLDEAIVLCPWT